MNKFLVFLITSFTLISSVYAEDLRFVQIDSLNYSNDETSQAKLQKLVSNINTLRNVSFVVFTGNNLAKPKQEDLENFLKQAKKLHSPFYIVLGNKDVNKQKNMSKVNYMKTVSKFSRAHKRIESSNYVFEKQGIVFIVLDGSKEVIPSPMGYYKPETVSWLDEQLRIYQNKNVVIIQHFPIIPPSEKESRYTSRPENCIKTIAKYKNIKAIVSGHFDTNNESDIGGIKFISTSDAPKYRVIDILGCETKNPEIWSVIKE